MMAQSSLAAPQSRIPYAALSADEFVARLLTIEDAEQRRALIERCPLSPAEVDRAGERLLNEALALFGVDPRRMERICGDALVLARVCGDTGLRALATMRSGDACLAQGQNGAALTRYDDAEATFACLGMPLEAARTRIGWVIAASRLGRPAEALAAARSARRVFTAQGDFAACARLDVNAGNIHAEAGHYRAALRSFSSALRIYMSMGEPERVRAARCQANRGLALAHLGRYRRALAELELARTTYERTGEAAGIARVGRYLGLTLLGLGRYTEALQAFETARAGDHELGLYDGGALACDTADCYIRLNRPTDALAALDSAEEELRRLDTLPDLLGVAARRVVALQLLGQDQEALAVAAEAERRFPAGAIQHRAWLAGQQAFALLRGGARAEALVEARRARALARSAGMTRLAAEAEIVSGSALLALGRVQEAAESAARARRQARSVAAAPVLYQAHELLGRLAEAEGRPNLARRRYSAAVEALEREQQGVIFEFRDAFAAGRYGTYERLAALQLEAGRAEEAFSTAERAKSRALADAIEGRIALRPRGVRQGGPLSRELAEVREDYAATAILASRTGDDPEARRLRDHAAQRLPGLEAQLTSLVRRLQLEAPDAECDTLSGSKAGLRPSQLQAGSGLLEFFFSGDDILRFWLDGSGLRGTRLRGAVPEAERLLRIFRLNLDTAERAGAERRDALTGQMRAVLRRLHNLLLANLPELDSCRSLIVVPHGFLHYLPFHALDDGTHYLIERLSISYAPSASVYSLCRSRPSRRRGGALILAHSDGGRLPFAISEGLAAGDIFQASVYQESAATRGLLETAGRHASLIHIAAHGRFRPDAPLFSAIELADGPLTTADIYGLELRAGLVTLSACETGRAQLGGGDELVGLARAFLYAGAASVLVSQWRVHDVTTAELMADFCRELRRGAGCAEALRRAQIRALSAEMPQNGQGHPFLWAGFQIIGAGGPLLKLRRISRRRNQL